MCWLLLRAP
jgi:hypothetical protein